MNIETYHYQRSIVLKELVLMSVQTSGSKVEKVFQIVKESNQIPFMEMLMMSPEKVENICNIH